MNKFLEFFQSDNGKPCIAHLMMFMAFFPATYVLIQVSHDSKSADALAVYLAGFVANRLWGKYMDLKNQGAQP